ncbi:MAG: SDH family Clp fold serine proteinase [Nannocystaceae bacterium]
MNTRNILTAFAALAVGSLLTNLAWDALASPLKQVGKPRDSNVLRLGDRFGDAEVVDLVSALARRRGQRTVLVIHTFGGELSHVARLAEAVHAHGQVEAWVPARAMSGGALVALASSQIVMWPDSCLGPIDPQLFVGFMGVFSAHSIARVIATKEKDIDEFWLASGNESARALRDVQALVTRYGVPEAALGRFINKDHSHGFPIFAAEAQELGLDVLLASPSIDRESLIEEHRHAYQ